MKDYILILPLFVIAQVIATFSSGVTYPFSPYRMFSKNWKDGIVMERIHYVTLEGKSYQPWDLLKIPFFQANHLSFETFLDEAPLAKRSTLCALLLKAAVNSTGLKVIAEEILFTRKQGVMLEEVVSSEVKYVCR